jgi:hypothetical protein
MPSVAAYMPLHRHIIKSVQINRSTAPEGISKNLCYRVAAHVLRQYKDTINLQDLQENFASLANQNYP